MTPPIVKRYFIAFEKYKWIGLASFVFVVVGSTVVGIQPDPPPTYIADGALTYTSPPVSFSATGSEIQQQGQGLSEQVLLSNQIIEAVATKVNIKPERIATNVALNLPSKAEGKGAAPAPAIIGIKYKDNDPKKKDYEEIEEMVKLKHKHRDIDISV